MSLLSLWRRQDRNPLSTLQSEMNSLFDDFFGGRSPLRGMWGDGREAFLPAVDVHETEDKVIIEAELPGVDPKEVDIRVKGDSLIIGGERKLEREEKVKGYHRVERFAGRFHRELELPYGTDANKIEAAYKDGVLTVEIAKKEEAKPRTIAVKVKS